MMVIILTEKGTICILINVATPSERRVIARVAEKNKYKNFRIEIQRMWNMKCFVIRVMN
jgi:hypothetical protein